MKTRRSLTSGLKLRSLRNLDCSRKTLNEITRSEIFNPIRCVSARQQFIAADPRRSTFEEEHRLSTCAPRNIGSFNRKRKPLVFFFGPFRSPFFHQGLKWFLFILFSTVVTFTHVNRSLCWGLIGCTRIAYRSMPPQAPTPPHYTEQQFLNFFPLPHWQGSLRPTFFSAIVGFSGFNKRFRSLTSSGFSGSNAIR